MRVRPAAIIMATATLGGLAGILTTFSVGCRSTGSKAPAWLQSAPLDCSMALSGQLGWLLENREFQSAITRYPLADQTLDLFLKKAKINPAGETGRVTFYVFDVPRGGSEKPEDMAGNFLLQFDGFKDPRALQLALAESFPPEGSLTLDKKDCPLYVMMDFNKVKIRAMVDPQQRILIGDLRALGRRVSQGTLQQKANASHALGAGEWIDPTAPIAGYINPRALLAGLGDKIPKDYAKEIPQGLESMVWSVTPATDPKAPNRLELSIGGSPEGINQASHWLQRLVALAGQIGVQHQLAPVLIQEKTRVGIRCTATNEQLNAILGRLGQPWVTVGPGDRQKIPRV